MILHLLRMRRNVNRSVFNDRENISATALQKPMNVFGTQMSEAYFLCLSQHSGENKGVDRLVIE